MKQEIHYCTASDGVRLAYSIVGAGTPIVRTPHWFAHLEHDLTSSAMRHMLLTLIKKHSLLRFDPRGIGLSQRDITELSFDRWVSDLETVIDDAGLDKVILFGLSQGASQAITYVHRHPGRVSHLIIVGGYARGVLHRDNLEEQRESLALSRALVRGGWGSSEESYRQFFTSQFIPDGTPEQHHSLNEMARVAATPEMAEKYLTETADINVTDLLPKVKTPTLILHGRGDRRVPFCLGQEIAANIPGAKFVPLETNNHVLMADEPATRTMFDSIADFLGEKRFRGPLPGAATISQRLEQRAKAIEQNWVIKILIILAAIAGLVIAIIQVWKLLNGD